MLSNVAVIGKSGESTESFRQGDTAPVQDASTKSDNSAPVIAAVTSVINEPVTASTGEKIRISPRARRIAQDKGIDYSTIAGSGPNGRIVSADIESASSSPKVVKKTVATDGKDYTEQPLSNVRKLIARAMHASLQNSAQLTHHMSADVRKLMDARQKIKKKIAAGENQQDITLNDMICWCVIRALEKFPEANSHFLDDRIKTFTGVHLGIAVDTPRGLMVPVVKNAGDMDLAGLSAALKSVADSSRKGSISPELIQSTAASFTVSNLGKLRGRDFHPGDQHAAGLHPRSLYNHQPSCQPWK